MNKKEKRLAMATALQSAASRRGAPRFRPRPMSRLRRPPRLQDPAFASPCPRPPPKACEAAL